MGTDILTVTQVNTYIKNIIDEDVHLKTVFLEGEISNLTDHYSSGHIYFSLKDSKSVIKAVMFRFSAQNLKFKPEDGMKVICRGRITVYEARGYHQIVVDDMQPDGIGVLAIQFEQLKNKLEKEGLFDKEHKKELPPYPERIGVITSSTGAAVRDIINIISRRYPIAEIVLSNVLVQGEKAAEDLTASVKRFSKLKNVDLIIIGRGGGSMEDLWAFNDEKLIRAIYDCPIPVVSAVGHETDFTLCDFVSDLRAPTPSAAAELSVPDREELLLSIESNKHYIDNLMDMRIKRTKDLLDSYSKIILAHSPKEKIRNIEIKLENYNVVTNQFINNKFDEENNNLEKLSIKLENLNPVLVIKRGFSYVTKDDKNISSVRDVSKGDIIDIKVDDGNIKAEVL